MCKTWCSLALTLVCASTFAGESELERFLAPTLASKSVTVTASPQTIAEWGGLKVTSSAGKSLVLSNAVASAVANNQRLNVVLNDGDYGLKLYSHIVFTNNMCGTPACPVTIKARNPGKVRLLGQKPIPTSKFSPVAKTDPVYARLPASARDHVRVMDLRHEKDYQIPSSLMEGRAPENKNPASPIKMRLYLGGRIQELARWPNKTREDSRCWANFTGFATNANKQLTFGMPDGRAANWSHLTDGRNGVRIHCTAPWSWHDEYMKVASFDAATRQLLFSDPLDHDADLRNHSVPQSLRFVACNVVEELDAPGEWWIELDTGTEKLMRLYYYPEDSYLNGSEELVLVDDHMSMIRFAPEIHDIRFEGLVFAYYGTILADYATNRRITFDSCEFHSFRGNTDLKGSDYTFRNCFFHDFTHSVFHDYGGDRATLESSGNLFDGCTFTRFCQWYISHFAAIDIRSGSGTAIRNCRFSDAPHTAIVLESSNAFVGWSGFSNLMQETVDSGMIYSGHTTRNLGNVVLGCQMSGSRPVDPTSEMANDSRSFACYFDDGVWGGDMIGCDVSGTVNSVFLRGGNLHKIMWNRVTDTKVGLSIDRCVATQNTDALFSKFTKENYNSPTGDNWFTSWYVGCNAPTPAIDYTSRIWRASFPTLQATIEDPTYRIEPWNNRFEGNLYDNVGRAYSDVSTDGGRTMNFWNNVFGRTTDPVGPHPGFTSLARPLTENDVPGFTAARQRIATLANVPSVDVTSPGGPLLGLRVRFGLDAIARLCVRAELNGKDWLAPSPMGLTYNDQNRGRLVLLGEPTVTPAEGGRSKRVLFPLEDIVDGDRSVLVEALVRDDGFAYRFVKNASVPWHVVDEGWEWHVAPGVDTNSLVCSAVATPRGVFTADYRTAWRECRVATSTTVQKPELPTSVLPQGLTIKDFPLADPRESRFTLAYDTANRKVVATLNSGYSWSDNDTSRAVTLSCAAPAAPALSDGWDADGRNLVYVRNGVPYWRLAATVNGSSLLLKSHPDSRTPPDKTLDLIGIEAAFARAGYDFHPEACLIFQEGSGLTAFSSVQTLAITNSGFLAKLPKAALKPFSNLVTLLLGSTASDLTIGQGSTNLYKIEATDNVFGRNVPTLRTIDLVGDNVTLRNAFGNHTNVVRLAQVSVRAAGNLDLGTHAFSSEGPNSITNVLFSAGGDIRLGAYTLRYTMANNAKVTIVAPPAAKVSLDGQWFLNQYSAKTTLNVYWCSPPPVTSHEKAICGCLCNWFIANERAASYSDICSVSGFAQLPQPSAEVHLDLPPRPASTPVTVLTHETGKWYQYYEDKIDGDTYGSHGTAQWYRHSTLTEARTSYRFSAASAHALSLDYTPGYTDMDGLYRQPFTTTVPATGYVLGDKAVFDANVEVAVDATGLASGAYTLLTAPGRVSWADILERTSVRASPDAIVSLSLQGNALVLNVHVHAYGDNHICSCGEKDHAIPVAGLSIELPDDTFVFTGEEIRPVPSVFDRNDELEEGRDYTIAYRDNLFAGTAALVITGCGDFAGEKIQPFAIAPAPIESLALVSTNIVRTCRSASAVATNHVSVLPAKLATYAFGSASNSNNLTLATNAHVAVDVGALFPFNTNAFVRLLEWRDKPPSIESVRANGRDFTDARLGWSVSYRRDGQETSDITSTGVVEVVVTGITNLTGSASAFCTIAELAVVHVNQTIYPSILDACIAAQRGDIIPLPSPPTTLDPLLLKPGVTIDLSAIPHGPSALAEGTYILPGDWFDLHYGSDTVTIGLNESARPRLFETDAGNPMSLTDEAVSLLVDNVKPGLFYGLASADSLDGLATRRPDSWTQAPSSEPLRLVAPRQSEQPSGFYRAVTTDLPDDRSAEPLPAAPIAYDWGWSNVVSVADVRYVVLAFTNSTPEGIDFTLPDGVTTVDYLLVAGGGAGGSGQLNSGAGGGGAGGVREGALIVSGGERLHVVIGKGGTPGSTCKERGHNGGDSALRTTSATLVVSGGGGGAGTTFVPNVGDTAGAAGGSGGGATGTTSSGTNQLGGKGSSDGNDGGNGFNVGAKRSGGGGGGAGSPGSQPATVGSGLAGGAGGNGIVSAITGSPVVYGGGGSGGNSTYNEADNPAPFTPGGAGGGGAGGGYDPARATYVSATAGTDGLGAGGGGGLGKNAGQVGGRGGDGIVILRYAK